MAAKKKPLHFGSLAAGFAAGAGAVIAAKLLGNDPERNIEQILVNRALGSKYAEIVREGPIPLAGDYRYVIFSDHHKGARNAADDFRFCEQTYLKALDYYFDRGFTLIVLGDVEELLEEEIPTVMRSYANVFHSEARFHPGRLVRVFGNHDIAWKSPDMVQKYMDPLFPGIQFREGLLFEVPYGDEAPAKIFLLHGFQGSLDSDVLASLATWVLPLYRNFQIRTRLGATYPSRDACLRSAVDNRLYRWASRQGKLIMICGHTHRPVWSSKTLLDKLAEELYALLRRKPEEQPPDHEKKIGQKKRELEERRVKEPPCSDILKTRPSYFNAGCCRFKDGDITGIEMESGTIRLVKWSAAGDSRQPLVLEENELREIFLYL